MHRASQGRHLPPSALSHTLISSSQRFCRWSRCSLLQYSRTPALDLQSTLEGDNV